MLQKRSGLCCESRQWDVLWRGLGWAGGGAGSLSEQVVLKPYNIKNKSEMARERELRERRDKVIKGFIVQLPVYFLMLDLSRYYLGY